MPASCRPPGGFINATGTAQDFLKAASAALAPLAHQLQHCAACCEARYCRHPSDLATADRFASVTSAFAGRRAIRSDFIVLGQDMGRAILSDRRDADCVIVTLGSSRRIEASPQAHA